MVTTFCLRLALGMLAPMIVLPIDIVPPRFFRVQFLSALPLVVIAGLFLPDDDYVGDQRLALWFWLTVTGVVAVYGGIVWHTDEVRGGRAAIALASIAAIFSLGCTHAHPKSIELPAFSWADDLASAFLLGSAISAMLMGHSYLIAPAMSLSPLNRLLGLLAAALIVRIGLACFGLYCWTRLSTDSTFDMETKLWLAARWLVGLLIPAGLTWMAWESARIRSTQSATGILYVVTVLVFLGELVSMLLVEKTRLPM